MHNDTIESKESTGKSLFDGWNAPPNLVTYSRIILVVVFLGLYIAAGPWGMNNLGMRWVAAVLFIVAASTDKIDGWMARKYDQVTELGKLMDPIADKLLTCATLVVAAAFGELGAPVLGWIVTLLFLVREIGITVMRFFVIDSGGHVIAAAWPGKMKTLFQCIGLSMLMLPVWQFAPDTEDSPFWLTAYLFVTYLVIYIALMLCLYSGAEYLMGVFGSAKGASKGASRHAGKHTHGETSLKADAATEASAVSEGAADAAGVSDAADTAGVDVSAAAEISGVGTGAGEVGAASAAVVDASVADAVAADAAAATPEDGGEVR